MRQIVLISCVKRKASFRTKASLLYTSNFFKKNLAYAGSLASDAIYILSAKHGLLDLDTEIEPYEVTLNAMPLADVEAWADRVLGQLRLVSDLREDRFIVLAGKRYRRFITPSLAHYEVPMEGLGIGKQLRFLKDKTQKTAS